MCLKVEFYPKEEENHINFQCLRAEETRVLREKREAGSKQNEKAKSRKFKLSRIHL